MLKVLFVVSAALLLKPPLKGTGQKRVSPAEHLKPAIACPDKDAAASCRSFNEMLNSGDSEMRQFVVSNSLVCFYPKTDEFFVVSGALLPMKDGWLKVVDSKEEWQPGDLFLWGYRNGTFNTGSGGMIRGKWRRGLVGNDPTFEGKAADSLSGDASLDMQDLLLNYSYETQSGKLGTRHLAVRLSTSRYMDKYTVRAAVGDEDRWHYEGRCLTFHNPSREYRSDK